MHPSSRWWACLGACSLVTVACTSVASPDGNVDGGPGAGDAAAAGDAGAPLADGGRDRGPSDYPTTECISAELDECIELTPGPAVQTDTEPSSGAGGEAFDDACPPGQVLIGFEGTRFDGNDPSAPGRSDLAGLRARCAALEVDAHSPYLVKVTPTDALETRGAADGGGGEWDTQCGEDQVVVAYQVSTAESSVRSLRIECAAVFWASTAPGEGRFLVGVPATLPWTVEHDGEVPPVVPCPDGAVATGVHGRSGAWVDSVGLHCRRFGLSSSGGIECNSDEITGCIPLETTGHSSTDIRPQGAQGGSAFEVDCPVGQVLVGLQVDFLGQPNGLLSGVEGRCATVDVSAAEPRSIALSPGASLDRQGGDDPAGPTERMCPDGEVVVGFDARVGDWLDALALRCAPVSWMVGPGLAPGEATALPWAGSTSSAPVPSVDCDAPEVAIGLHGRSGAWLDAFGLRCGSITQGIGD